MESPKGEPLKFMLVIAAHELLLLKNAQYLAISRVKMYRPVTEVYMCYATCVYVPQVFSAHCILY